jgi:hypothetical protein
MPKISARARIAAHVPKLADLGALFNPADIVAG